MTLLPSYLIWWFDCGVLCGASRLGPTKNDPELISSPVQQSGRALLPDVASTIWFWNFRYEKRMLCEKVPVLKSTPTTCCRV